MKKIILVSILFTLFTCKKEEKQLFGTWRDVAENVIAHRENGGTWMLDTFPNIEFILNSDFTYETKNFYRKDQVGSFDYDKKSNLLTFNETLEPGANKYVSTKNSWTILEIDDYYMKVEHKQEVTNHNIPDSLKQHQFTSITELEFDRIE